VVAAAHVAAAAIFLPVLAFSTTFITDTDVFWHLASGDWIRRTGTIPRSDPFSFTVLGHRWVDIHWLFQVVLSFVHEKGGWHALEILRSALILGVFAALFQRCRRAAGPATAGAVLLLVTLACQERFLMRPEIVSWGLMLAVLAVLERALDAPTRAARARWLFAVLPIVQIVWVNVQGLFALEPGFIALALLATLIERGRDPDRRVDFLLALSLATVVSLVNPFGAAALRLPLEEFFGHLGGKSLLSLNIAEFQPPLSGYLVTPSIAAFVVLASLTILVLLLDLRHARVFDLLIALATLVLALRARRNIPIFALATAPVLARHSSAIAASISRHLFGFAAEATGRAKRARAGARFAASALLIVLACGLTFSVVTNRFFLLRPTERWFGSGEIPDYFPEESARFVERAGLPGNVFHSLAVGGYLIHAWKGERGVFIDGRNDPYLEDVLPAYLKAIADPAVFEEVARRYQITTVLWSHQRALEGKRLLSYLARGHGWVMVHLDPGAAVYVRADLLSPARLEDAPFPAGRDRRVTYEELAGRLDQAPFHGPPIREIALGEFFSVSGDAAGAEFFYRRALERLPRNAVVLYGYALALERQGRTKEARAAYAQAAASDPGYLPALAADGVFLLEEGRLQEAEEALDAAYRGGERSARLLESRARLFEQKGDTAKSLEAFREALTRSPQDTDLLRAVALYYLRHDDAPAALPFYASASRADPDDPVIAREMAALLVRLGRTSAALDATREGCARALRRLAGGRTDDWTDARAAREEDRRLLLFAAELEAGAGERARASEYRQALAAAGLAAD
jgi:tetratricopeptide (TPR) repeat protein